MESTKERKIEESSVFQTLEDLERISEKDLHVVLLDRRTLARNLQLLVIDVRKNKG